MSDVLGNLFIVAAPSGAGKSSLINALLKKSEDDVVSNGALLNKAQLSVSHTTRSPRPGEKDGIHYHFISKDEFQKMVNRGDFYEYAEVFGNYYGTSKSSIMGQLQNGIDVLLDIDWQGARQVKALNPEVTSLFIMPPSIDALRERLSARGQDSEEVINSRMSKAMSEMSHYGEFDYVILNDEFERALHELRSIVTAASLVNKKQALRYESVIKTLI